MQLSVATEALLFQFVYIYSIIHLMIAFIHDHKHLVLMFVALATTLWSAMRTRTNT